MPHFKSASATAILTFLLIMGLDVFLLSATAVCQDESPPQTETLLGDSEPKGSPLTLVDFPRIEVTEAILVTEEEAKTIELLIKDLANSREIDFHSVMILTGEDFAPIGGSEQSVLGLKATHWLKGNKSFKRLVELGPKALPVLLRSLDDPSPTGLNADFRGVKIDDNFGG